MNEQLNSPLDVERILVVTTGGTIDKVYFDDRSTFEVGDSVVSEIVKAAHGDHPFHVHELMRKDSLHLDDADRALIADTIGERQERKVIITHGTDTMTETAEVLMADARLKDRSIVLTGSLAPARFAASDAVFNLGMAFGAVLSAGPGVRIAMNGRVFNAGSVKKDPNQNRFVFKES